MQRTLGPRQRGAALLIVIALVMLVAALGAAVAIATRTETLVAANFRQGREALYAAEGAVGIALRDLAAIADWGPVLTGAATSSFTDGSTIGSRTLPGGETVTLCCAASSLTADVQQRALGGRDWDGDTPQWQIFAWGPASGWLAPGRIDSAHYVVVWVADDPVDGDGNPAADTNGILELHAQALGPGGSRRIIEASVRRQTIGEESAAGPGVKVLSWREIRW